ncbi:MAG: tetratricopeptide repeat protein [Pyrinomonadaceae bacterium]
MRKHTLITASLAFVLLFGSTAVFWSADSMKRDGDTDANILAANGSPTGASETGKKSGGNGVVRILKTPWRAVSRLFGHGDDKNKLQRLSEKDTAKFESAGVARVDDSSTAKRADANLSARDHLAAGKSLLESGRVNEAIAELSLAASLDADLSEADGLLGVAFDRKQMPEKAREYYKRALRNAPEDAQTLNNLGFSLYRSGNYRAAIDRLKRAARLAPNDERILNNLALAQCRMGKYDDAYKSFGRAGGELNAYLNVATLLERAGRDTEAIKHYEAARRLDPNSTIAVRRLADLYTRSGKTAEADAARRDVSGHERETIAARIAGN